jgi:cob(I)alamin adenosyltransferase
MSQGDRGKSLIKGKKYPKDSLLLEALGSIDELNCWLGLIRSKIDQKEVAKTLFSIQKDLQQLAAVIAGYKKNFSDGRVKLLQESIAEQQKQLSPLSQFIIPGDDELAALVHLARAVCRRTERRIVALGKRKGISQAILSYLNRLSTFLFGLARLIDEKY